MNPEKILSWVFRTLLIISISLEVINLISSSIIWFLDGDSPFFGISVLKGFLYCAVCALLYLIIEVFCNISNRLKEINEKISLIEENKISKNEF